MTPLLFAAFAVLAVIDWVAVERGNRRLEYVCKPGATLALVGLALALDPEDPAARAWFVAALVASLAGDVFLMLEDRWFVAGLASFLAGHIAYVVGLGLLFDSTVALGVGVALVIAAVPTVGTRVIRGARRTEPAMAVPVAVYMAAVSAMLVAAFGTADWRAMLGALLFYGSDATIGWHRFVGPVPHRDVAVMSTYHLGQLLLVLSLLG